MDQHDDAQQDHSAHTIVPGRYVRLGGDAARILIGRPDTPGEPRIELIRSGDVIQAIDVTCTCGHRVRLRCNYAQ